ncbi:MAG: 2-dehydropantoate 2-reductase [Azospirillum brasilense]|nr:MAG: 2-dehydropantoate 2-reductase [Azospirillum brasilense]
MKVCVFGAGAIGGHLAMRLAKGGAEVSVVARGAQLAAIRARGLTVRAYDGEHNLRVTAAEEPAELGPQDAVVVTTKSPALPQVARAIVPLLGPETAVAFVMNGIPWWYPEGEGGVLEGRDMPELDPGGVLHDAVGIRRAIGGVVYSSCTVVEPGVVSVEGKINRLILGEPDGRATPRVEALAALFRAGGLSEVTVTAEIRKEVWAKLMGNISSGPLCILTRRNLRETYADPAITQAAVRMTREAQAIAAGLGIVLDFDPVERISRAAQSAHKPSILQDLELGRPMEIETMLLAPLRLARMVGVETPTLDLAVALAKSAAEGAGLYTPGG